MNYLPNELFIIPIDILIYPNIPQLNLSLNTNYTMECLGNVPIIWRFNDSEVSV